MQGARWAFQDMADLERDCAHTYWYLTLRTLSPLRFLVNLHVHLALYKPLDCTMLLLSQVFEAPDNLHAFERSTIIVDASHEAAVTAERARELLADIVAKWGPPAPLPLRSGAATPQAVHPYPQYLARCRGFTTYHPLEVRRTQSSPFCCFPP